jgi:hypothetical protein
MRKVVIAILVIGVVALLALQWVISDQENQLIDDRDHDVRIDAQLLITMPSGFG